MGTAFEAHSSHDHKDFLRLVDCMYAAGCAETSWDRPVKEVCRLGGFGSCALTSVDPLEGRAVLWASHGLMDRTPSGRSDIWTALNPLLTDGVLRSPPGAVWHDRRIMSPALLATTSFWTEWMQPHDFVSWVCLVVGKEGRRVVCLEVFLRRGGASSHYAAVDLLAQLAPHLTRAWRLGKTARSSPPHGAAPLAAAPPRDREPAAGPPSEAGRMASTVQLRAAFGLSKAEARLALYLAAGASLASMAEAFDVKLTTIRSQLQQVFSKTGTSRQAELVALLLSRGYVDPIAPAQESAGQRSSYPPRALEPAN
jgi:DNA-binding CsgD family transcriptional regulator